MKIKAIGGRGSTGDNVLALHGTTGATQIKEDILTSQEDNYNTEIYKKKYKFQS